jgi:hypothetical protein
MLGILLIICSGEGANGQIQLILPVQYSESVVY